MSKFEYEKNNAIVTLKNEAFGLKQIIADLKKLASLDFAPIENKILNVKVKNFLHENLEGYVTLDYNEYTKEHIINVMVKDRYNVSTKSYVGHYDRYRVKLGLNINISDAGKQQTRFDALKTIENANFEIERLEKELVKIENELANIDETLRQYEEIHAKVKEFKKERTSFFLDNFKDLNGFY